MKNKKEVWTKDYQKRICNIHRIVIQTHQNIFWGCRFYTILYKLYNLWEFENFEVAFKSLKVSLVRVNKSEKCSEERVGAGCCCARSEGKDCISRFITINVNLYKVLDMEHLYKWLDWSEVCRLQCCSSLHAACSRCCTVFLSHHLSHLILMAATQWSLENNKWP